jgi:signal transduction histidine kinase
LTQNNGEIAISVTDTGSGIDPNVLPHIFEPFYTVRTRDGSGGGLGIGLTLTKGLAEIHGGTIAVTSPGIGKGSKFTITLPAGQGLP